jgi:hypothetical protein
MELKDFIKQSLVDIVVGIREAQSVSEVGTFIVPTDISPNQNNIPQNRGVGLGSFGLMTTVVEFDIAVTAETHDTKTGKAGVSVKIVEAGVQGQTGSKNTEVSRIQFSVPLKLTKGQNVPGNRAGFAEMD